MARWIRLSLNIVPAALLIASGIGPANAQSLEEAACLAFAGSKACRTVSIVDAENCIVKVRPHPVPPLDPAIAGCLIDDIMTRKLFLRNARLEYPAAMTTASKSTIGLAGREAVHVLTKYDENGAPVWEKKNADIFEHEGDPERTAKAIERLSKDLCKRQSPATGSMSLARVPGNGSKAQIIGVREAFTRAARGELLLIDIRHESEWRRTGVGENAIPITMHQRMGSFLDHLEQVTGKDNGKPIALICAGGVRSAFLQRLLQRNGYSEVVDVPEGMVGDLGWIKSGLPTRSYRRGQAR